MWGSFRQAFGRVRRADLEVAGLLPPEQIQQAVTAAGYVEHARVYTAVTTMLTFLTQVLRADRSCQQAVSGLIAQRVAAGQPPSSADTGAYCKARQRLPEAACWDLQRQIGRVVEEQAPPPTLCCGRRIGVGKLRPQRFDLAGHRLGGALGGLAQLDAAGVLFQLLVIEPLGRHRPLRQRLDLPCRTQQHLAVLPRHHAGHAPQEVDGFGR